MVGRRGENKITLWCSSQGHFQIGENTAMVLGLASSQVKVIPMEIGGGFGGKTTTIYLEPVAAPALQEERPARQAHP